MNLNKHEIDLSAQQVSSYMVHLEIGPWLKLYWTFNVKSLLSDSYSSPLSWDQGFLAAERAA